MDEGNTEVTTGSTWTQLANLPREVAVATEGTLKANGYTSVQQLRNAKSTQEEWRGFAERVGIPDAAIDMLAPEFGPHLPSGEVALDRHDRLAAELRAWFGGDFDNAQHGRQGNVTEFKYLIHDTSFDTAQKIIQEGRLAAYNASDVAYDGHLILVDAPPVVFFQLSQNGVDQSIYPRFSADNRKARFLVLPATLALHTSGYRMYFVSITEPRKDRGANRDGNDLGFLQLHVLFIPIWHRALQFCDKHFLPVNKLTFQPFHYRNNMWNSYSYTPAEQRGDPNYVFFGRKLKVNICVAADVPINGTSSLLVPLPNTKQCLCKFCLSGGQCQNRPDFFHSKPQALLVPGAGQQ